MEKSIPGYEGDIIDLNNKYFAISYNTIKNKNKYDIIDKSSGLTHVYHVGDKLKSLENGKVVKIVDKKIILINENLKAVLKEASFDSHYSHVEVINENLVVASGYKCICFFRFLSGNLVKQFDFETFDEIKGIIKLSENQILYFTHDKVYIRDSDGWLVCKFDALIGKYASVKKLSEKLLIVENSSYSVGKNIHIWNYEIGYHVKEIPNCNLIGIVPFGFLVSKIDETYPFVLHAYDKEANSIGAILTDSISQNEIRKVTYIHDNSYAFYFARQIKFIKCNVFFFITFLQ